MSDNQENIEMKPINKQDEMDRMKELMLADGDDVAIWEDSTPAGKTIFINIGNATTSMPENVFYELTKLCQQAAKSLLGIE
jgi:hypothetical protein